MIMIAVPTQVTVKPKGDAPVDSTALTREVVPEREISPSENSEDDAYRLAPQEPPASEESTNDSVDAVGIASDWCPDDAPLVPSGDWASESSARTRQYLLVGILGFSGVLAAVVGFFAFLNWFNNAKDAPVNLADGQQAADVAQGSVGDAVSELDPRINLSEPADLPEGEPEDGGAAATEASVADQALPEQGAQAPVLEQSFSADEAEGQQAGVLGIDDGNSVGAGALPPSLTADESETDSSPADSTDSELSGTEDSLGLPEQLRAMELLLGGYEVPLTISDEGVVPSKAPLLASELGLAASVGLDPLEPVDIAEQSSKTLHALAIRKAPALSRFVNLWTHLSGMPVVVDFSSLATAGIDRNAPPELPPAVRGKTFGELLSGIAKLNGMKMQVIENRFVRLHAAATDVVPASVDVSELVVDASQQAWLESMLRAFYLPTASADAAKAIRVEAGQLSYDSSLLDSATWGEVVRTVETWRNLQLGSTSDFVKLPSQFLVTLVRDDRKLTQLEHVSAVVSPQSRPVGQVLSQLCGEAGLNCWIDWAAVGAVGLGPETTQVVVTRGRTLRRILADYARVYPLRVAILDDSSVWITSPIAYRSTVQVFVLPADGKTALQWQSELRRLTPSYVSENPESPASRSVLTELSPDRRYVFVRSCLPEVDLAR